MNADLFTQQKQSDDGEENPHDSLPRSCVSEDDGSPQVIRLMNGQESLLHITRAAFVGGRGGKQFQHIGTACRLARLYSNLYNPAVWTSRFSGPGPRSTI